METFSTYFTMAGCGASGPAKYHTETTLTLLKRLQPEINIRNWMLPHVMKHPEAIPPLFLNFADDLDPRKSLVQIVRSTRHSNLS